ncbi:MAG: AAA family ATPase [Acidimicrobiales bacterium]
MASGPVVEPSGPRVRIELCGGLRILRDGVPVDTELFGGRRARWAFAYLVLERHRSITRDELAEAIWPGEVPPTWPSAVRSALSRIRDVGRAAGLGDDVVRVSHGLLQLDVTAATIDLVEAEAALREVEAALADAATAIGPDLVPVARHATTVLAAPVLADVETDWADALRRQARTLRLRALDAWSHASARTGDLATAVEVAEQAFGLDPLRETVTRSLMAWHADAGRRGEALRAYQRLRTVLVDELGVDPSPETEQAYLQVLGHRATDPVVTTGRRLPPALQPRDDVPFVGRDAELRALLDWSSTGGGARVLVVEGEPGIGKSRLVREAAHRWHAEGADVAHAQFEQHRPGSLAPLAELLGDAPAAAVLLERLRPAGRSEPGTGAATTATLDDGEREAVLDEVAVVLADRSRDGRLVVVLDDAQWAGAAAMSVITRLVRRPQADVHVVAITRPAADTAALATLVEAAVREAALTRLALSGLDAEATAALAEAAAEHPLDDEARRLVEQLRHDTAGNPLFLGEALRHLLATGDLAIDDQGRWSGDLRRAAAAPGVQGLVAARIAGLSPDASEVLATAAVIGTSFDLALLGDALDDGPAVGSGGGLGRAVDVIDAAIRAHLVRPLPDRPGTCRFAHGLVRDAILDATTAPRRMALHRRVGLALESGAAGASADRVDELADHFVAAAALGERDRAVQYSLDAADLAVRSLEYEAAASRATRALELAAIPAERAALLLVIGRAGIDDGDSHEAHQAFLDAADAARDAGDPVLFAEAALGATRGFRGGSEWLPEASGRALLTEALRGLDTAPALASVAAPPDADVLRRVEVLGRLALWTTGPDERQASARRAMDEAERIGSDTALIAAYGASRIVHWRPEHTDARIAFADRVIRAARHDPRFAAQVRFGRMGDLLQRGDRAEVDAELDALSADPVVLRSQRLRWSTAVWRAVMAVVDGRLDDVEPLTRGAFTVWGDEAHVDAMQAFANQLAALRVMQGRAAEAVAAVSAWRAARPDIAGIGGALAWVQASAGLLDEAAAELVELRRAGLPENNTFPATFTTAGAAVHAVGDVDYARVLLAQGTSLVGQLAYQPGPGVFLGPVDHTLGLLAITVGDHDAARAHLHRSVELAGRCGPWWVRRSQAVLDAL